MSASDTSSSSLSAATQLTNSESEIDAIAATATHSNGNSATATPVVVGDKSNDIEHVDVGDILFIKGKAYGGKPLVHRAPPKQYHANGRVLNRLLLKVDVVASGAVW